MLEFGANFSVGKGDEGDPYLPWYMPLRGCGSIITLSRRWAQKA
jgi:hypothetical protein